MAFYGAKKRAKIIGFLPSIDLIKTCKEQIVGSGSQTWQVEVQGEARMVLKSHRQAQQLEQTLALSGPEEPHTVNTPCLSSTLSTMKFYSQTGFLSSTDMMVTSRARLTSSQLSDHSTKLNFCSKYFKLKAQEPILLVWLRPHVHLQTDHGDQDPTRATGQDLHPSLL